MQFRGAPRYNPGVYCKPDDVRMTMLLEQFTLRMNLSKTKVISNNKYSIYWRNQPFETMDAETKTYFRLEKD